MSDDTWKLVRMGGVMRCCLQTLEMADLVAPPTDGDVLSCRYCRSALRFWRQAWEWKREAP